MFQNFSDAILFVGLGANGVMTAVFIMLIGLIFKVKWIYSIGLFLAGAGFFLMFLGGNLGGGVLIVGLEILIMFLLLKLGGLRFKPTATAPVTTPAPATPVTPATPAAGTPPAPTPTHPTAHGKLIFLGISLVLGLLLFAGANGMAFPGNSLIDPWMYKVGLLFYSAMTHSTNQVINMGYTVILVILIVIVLLRFLWRK